MKFMKFSNVKILCNAFIDEEIEYTQAFNREYGSNSLNAIQRNQINFKQADMFKPELVRLS